MIEIIPNWHPIFVHFTVALLSSAIGFYCLVVIGGISKWRFQWAAVARWNLWLGAIATIVTVIFGFLAFNSVKHDDPSHAAMLEHRNLALITLASFIPLAIWSMKQYRNDKDLSWRFIILLVAAGGLLGSTAWHGAELVYRHGLGVMSLPKVDQHSHAGSHTHANDGHSHDAPSSEAVMHDDSETVHDHNDGHLHDEAEMMEDRGVPASGHEHSPDESADHTH